LLSILASQLMVAGVKPNNTVRPECVEGWRSWERALIQNQEFILRLCSVRTRLYYIYLNFRKPVRPEYIGGWRSWISELV
jgi:hypothetical protein